MGRFRASRRPCRRPTTARMRRAVTPGSAAERPQGKPWGSALGCASYWALGGCPQAGIMRKGLQRQSRLAALGSMRGAIAR